MVLLVVIDPATYIDIVKNGEWGDYECERLYVGACDRQFMFFYTYAENGEPILLIPHRVLEVCEEAVERAVKKLMD